MRKITGPLATVALLLACGCDGYNTYTFHGQLVTGDSAPVSPGMSVHVLPASGGSAPAVFDSEFGITDEEGKFSGTLLSSTGWVPDFNPAPPTLHEVNVILSDATQTLTIPLQLTDAQQTAVKDGKRELNLGVIAAPASATSRPATAAGTQ